MTSLPLFKDLDPSVQEQLDLKTFQVGMHAMMGLLHANRSLLRENSKSKILLDPYQRSLLRRRKQVQSVCRII